MDKECVIDNWLKISEHNSRKNACVMQIKSIYQMEKKQKEKYTVMDYSEEIDSTVKHYIKMKLLLKRIDFELEEKYQYEIYDYIKENRVSRSFVVWILLKNMYHRKKVCKKLIQIYETKEGENSKYAKYYANILKGIGNDCYE